MSRIINTKALSNKFGVDDDLESLLKSLEDDTINSVTINDIPMVSQDKVELTEEEQSDTIIDIPNTPSITIQPVLSSTTVNIPQTLQNVDIDNISTNSRVDDEFAAKSIKELLDEMKEFVAAAKFLIHTSTTPEGIEAASKLFTSAGGLLKELSNINENRRREAIAIKMEKFKQKHRIELLEAKAMSKGDVNTVNNINVVAFSQESVVDNILKKIANKK